MPNDLQIVYRPLADLVPYARNARRHTDKQIAKMRASLARFGWANPMLIAGTGMIAGHARLRAAIDMAKDGQAIPRNDDPWAGPTVDLSHLSEVDRRAYILTDNRSALDAGWDNDMLKIEFDELAAVPGFDLGLTGFDKIELDTIRGTARVSEAKLTAGLRYQIVVTCRDEQHQAELLARLQGESLECRPLIL